MPYRRVTKGVGRELHGGCSCIGVQEMCLEGNSEACEPAERQGVGKGEDSKQGKHGGQ